VTLAARFVRTRGVRTNLGVRLLAAICIGLWVLSGTARGESEVAPVSRPAVATAAPVAKLPADQTTHHNLELSGRTLLIAATAGAIRLSNDKDEPRADVAFIAYQLENADRHTRPVTFVFNGGPGMASGWLQVGAIGPWRIAIGGDAGVPSAPP